MKTKIAFLLAGALFISAGKINLWHAQVVPKLLIGKWHTDAFLATPTLEFNTDSSAKLSDSKYRYYVRKDTIYLKDSIGANKSLTFSKLNKDTLQLIFFDRLRLNYTRVK